MKSYALTCLWFSTTAAAVVAAPDPEFDTRLSGTPDKRANLTLLAKPGSSRRGTEAQRKAAKLAGEQLIIQTQLAALETTIKDLNSKRELLEARKKEIATQLGTTQPWGQK